MQIDCKELLIPLINEVFGKDYSPDEKVILNTNEHVLIVGDNREKRIGDSSFSIRGDRYLFESQTDADNSMIVRMFEYIILDSFESNEYKGIVSRLTILTKAGELSYYESENIRDIMKYVLKHIARKYDNVREGVDAAMGGKVLEHPAKTIYNAGKNDGRLEGIREGRRDSISCMLSRGRTPEEINEFCGYSIDEINEVQESMLVMHC